MKTRRFFAVLMAVIISAVCFTVQVSADNVREYEYTDEEVTYGFKFDSYFVMEEALTSRKEYYSELIGWIGNVDGIYLPLGYDVQDIYEIYFNIYDVDETNKIWLYLKTESGKYAEIVFTQYISKHDYDFVLDSWKEESGEPKRLTYRETEMMLFDIISEDEEGRTAILWSENGHYFAVYTDLDPTSEEVLELTHYRKIPFNKGLVTRNGKFVYLDKKGNVVKKQGWKTWCGNRYYVRSNGTVITDTKKEINKVMYEFDKYGSAKEFTGWQRTKNGKRYYIGGNFVTGKQTIDGKKYMFDKNGYQK